MTPSPARSTNTKTHFNTSTHQHLNTFPSFLPHVRVADQLYPKFTDKRSYLRVCPDVGNALPVDCDRLVSDMTYRPQFGGVDTRMLHKHISLSCSEAFQHFDKALVFLR